MVTCEHDEQRNVGAAVPSRMAEDIPCWLPAGMDAKSSYMLKIKITSTTIRKDLSGFCFDKVLDSDTVNHSDFIADFGKQYPWEHNQVTKMYYVDHCAYHQVSSDLGMVQMFAKFANTKKIDILMHIHGVNEEPQLPTLANPCQAAPSEPSSSTHPSILASVDDSIVNPFPENEHVGVDDESMYLDDIVTEGGSAANGKEADTETDYMPNSSDSDEEANSVDEDWVANDAVPDNIPSINYDEENPPMSKGTSYPNLETFKMALSTYAIKGEFEYDIEKSDPEFEYDIEKSDPGRFKASCVDEDCEWRIYAKVMDDNVTVKVQNDASVDHTCESTRLNDVIQPATSKWVAEKVRAWLIEDATVRPKELRRKLHDKYKVLISAKKVYYGKEIALKKLYGTWEDNFDKLYNYKAEIERSSPEVHQREERRKMKMLTAKQPLCLLQL